MSVNVCYVRARCGTDTSSPPTSLHTSAQHVIILSESSIRPDAILWPQLFSGQVSVSTVTTTSTTHFLSPLEQHVPLCYHLFRPQRGLSFSPTVRAWGCKLIITFNMFVLFFWSFGCRWAEGLSQSGASVVGMGSGFYGLGQRYDFFFPLSFAPFQGEAPPLLLRHSRNVI